MPGEPFPSVPQGAPTISGCARRRWGRKRQEEQEMSQLDLDSKQQYGRTTAEQCNEEETFWEPWPWEPDEEARKPVWIRYVVCTTQPTGRIERVRVMRVLRDACAVCTDQEPDTVQYIEYIG